MSLANPIESLVVKLLGDSSHYKKTLKDVEGATSRMQRGMAMAGAGMTAAFTAPILAFSHVAKNAFMDFEDAMVKSTSIMVGVTKEQEQAMGDLARKLSMEYTAGPEKMAEAYFFLASAGMDAEQQMAALPQVAAFAQAGAFDLATATDLATDAQSALGLTSKDAQKNLANLTRVTDVLIAANTKANASAEQFSQALTRKSATALRGVNKDIEEGVAVLAVYADQGIKAANAGEKLTAFLREAQVQARKHGEAFEKLGVDVYDKTTGEMLHMADIVGSLEGALDGMTVQQKEAALAQLGFTAEAQAAINPLIGMSGRIRQLDGELRDVSGITKDVAKNQLGSLRAQAELTANTIKNFAIDIGDRLAPGMARMNDVIKQAYGYWKNLSDTQKDYAVAAAAAVAATGPLLLIMSQITPLVATMAGSLSVVTSGLGMLTGGISKIPSLLVKIGPLLAPLFGPAGLIVAGVAAAAAAIIYFTGAWEPLKAAAGSFFQSAKGFIYNFQENMAVLGKWILDTFPKIWANAGMVMGQVGKFLVQSVVAAVRTAIRLYVMLSTFIVANFVPAIVDAFKSFFFWSVDMLEWMGRKFIEFHVWLGKSFVQAFMFVGRVGYRAIEAVIKFLFDAVGSYFTTVGNFFKALFTGQIVSFIKEGLAAAWNQFFAFLNKVKDAFYKLFTLDFEFLDTLRKDAIEGASTKDLGQSIKDMLKEEMSSIDGLDLSSIGVDSPEFNFDLPNNDIPPIGIDEEALNTVAKANQEAVEAVKMEVQEQAVKASEDQADKAAEVSGLSTKGGFSAVEAGSAEAYRQAVRSQQNRQNMVQQKQLKVQEETRDAIQKIEEDGMGSKKGGVAGKLSLEAANV